MLLKLDQVLLAEGRQSEVLKWSRFNGVRVEVSDLMEFEVEV
jgi:hypothetical protein